MYEFFKKYWWVFALVVLGVIFVVLPKVDFGTMAMHPPESIGVGKCYNDRCLIKCYEKSASRPYYCSTVCGVKSEVMCDTDAECTEAHLASHNLDCDLETLPASENVNPSAKPGTLADTTTTASTKVVCSGGKLFKSGALYDDCEDKGCWTKNLAGVCKTGSSIGDWASDEAVKGVPNYLLALAGIFIMFMFSMAGRK